MAEKIGRYEIKKELGRGGMATVYLARDPRFRRDVAIKVLPPQFTHDPRFLARFEQEAQTIAALEEPANVPVYDFGEQDDSLYIVMRYMPGGSLRERIDGQPLPLEQIASILGRIAPALDEAHRRGIIHRDIKPDNVLFDHKDRPYLADFGIARMAEATHTTTVVGTPSHMSPEQVEGKQKLDWRSDLYALGVVLFEMLTGRQPYIAETPSGQMFMHVMEPVPNVLALNPDLPPETQGVIEKAMAKDREERYQSAREMAEEVASLRAAGGELVAGTALGSSADVDVSETPEDADPGQKKDLDPEGSGAIASEKTIIETPAEALPALAVSAEADSNIPAKEKRPVEKRSSWARLPAWAWWVGAGIVLILLVLGVRSAFLGGGGSSSETNGQEDTPIAAAAGATETATTTPLATMTATTQPTSTNTPSPTRTPTPKPSSTPTVDPSLPPPNPELGTAWTRPQDGMTMIYVPAGSFMMGSEDGSSDEQPVHEVTLDGFWIDQTEVTNAQYRRCVQAGDCDPSSYADDVVYNGNGYPVVGVNWYNAQTYCAWAEGRLPTEAEWEYAASGPESRKYPWGEDSPTCDLAQYSGCGGNTVPVGSFDAGASWVGALDMAGNVWEWVNDWYDDSYYATSPGDNPSGPESGSTKVLRGGSWRYNASPLRGANRGTGPADRGNSIGFRCALPGS